MDSLAASEIVAQIIERKSFSNQKTRREACQEFSRGWTGRAEARPGCIFELQGTIGQHDASNLRTGGVFEITGGFHRRAADAIGDAIFSNAFVGPGSGSITFLRRLWRQ